ncbi:hypothetical protein FKM82_009703 [Ascaphus truei]
MLLLYKNMEMSLIFTSNIRYPNQSQERIRSTSQISEQNVCYGKYTNKQHFRFLKQGIPDEAPALGTETVFIFLYLPSCTFCSLICDVLLLLYS